VLAPDSLLCADGAVKNLLAHSLKAYIQRKCLAQCRDWPSQQLLSSCGTEHVGWHSVAVQQKYTIQHVCLFIQHVTSQ